MSQMRQRTQFENENRGKNKTATILNHLKYRNKLLICFSHFDDVYICGYADYVQRQGQNEHRTSV